MDKRKIEKVSTSAGVILLAMLAIFGILGCFELFFDINFFYTARAADVWTVIPLITCVLLFCCFLVSTMLNISRMTESMETLSDVSKRVRTEVPKE